MPGDQDMKSPLRRGSPPAMRREETAREEGRPRRKKYRGGGEPMAGMGAGMKANTESRKKLAEAQKRDAKGSS